MSELQRRPDGKSSVAFGINVLGVVVVGSGVPEAFPAKAGTAPALAYATISWRAHKLTIAHAHRRSAPPAACVRAESGRGGKPTGHGAAAPTAAPSASPSASPRGSVGSSGNICFFACGAGQRGNGSAETNAAATAPFAVGVAGAHARLRAGMAESEGDRTGCRQNLV